MKVRELIEWLQTQPQDATVLLRDPDTEWLLPLRVGDQESTSIYEPVPAHGVVVHADYSDRWSDQ